MLDEFIVEQLEADLVACLDIVGLRSSARCALVAPQIRSKTRSVPLLRYS